MNNIVYFNKSVTARLVKEKYKYHLDICENNNWTPYYVDSITSIIVLKSIIDYYDIEIDFNIKDIIKNINWGPTVILSFQMEYYNKDNDIKLFAELRDYVFMEGYIFNLKLYKKWDNIWKLVNDFRNDNTLEDKNDMIDKFGLINKKHIKFKE